MAVTPLFVADMTELKKRLRLSSATQEGTLEQLDMAVQEVRSEFYGRLPGSRIAEIVGYPSEDNPSSANALVRTRAELCETKWVKAVLMKCLPLLFFDASNLPQRFNEEELTRDLDYSRVDDIVEDLMVSVHELLGTLEGEELELGVNVTVIGPSKKPCQPGQSVFPGEDYMSGCCS